MGELMCRKPLSILPASYNARKRSLLVLFGMELLKHDLCFGWLANVVVRYLTCQYALCAWIWRTAADSKPKLDTESRFHFLYQGLVLNMVCVIKGQWCS